MRLSDTSNLFPSVAISPREGREYAGRVDEYFVVGRLALDAVLFASETCDKPHFPRILDLAGGGGQVLRWLAAKFDYAKLTACDFDREQTEFCHSAFGATGVYAPPDLRRLSFAGPFDLVWCGNLFARLPYERWPAVLDFIEQWTADFGMIVFGLNGRFLASEIAREKRPLPAGADRAALLKQFDETGTAFVADPAAKVHGHGLSLASPEALGRLVQEHPSLILRGYLEQGWDFRDVAILYKSPAYFEPLALPPLLRTA